MIHHYNYDGMANLAVSGRGTVRIAVHDQREYVVFGKKSPNFVGIVRAGYGNVWSVGTRSGRPLANDMACIIAVSLANKGFHCSLESVLPNDSPPVVLEKLKTASSDRLIVLTLNEWRSESYYSVSLAYDIMLRIFSPDGTFLVGKDLRGNGVLVRSFWRAAYHARRRLPQAFVQKIEELFNEAYIAETLK